MITEKPWLQQAHPSWVRHACQVRVGQRPRLPSWLWPEHGAVGVSTCLQQLLRPFYRLYETINMPRTRNEGSTNRSSSRRSMSDSSGSVALKIVPMSSRPFARLNRTASETPDSFNTLSTTYRDFHMSVLGRVEEKSENCGMYLTKNLYDFKPSASP